MQLQGFFFIFKDFLRTFVMFVNMDMYEIALITSESRLWFLSSYFYWVIKFLMWTANYCFGMHAYVWWRIRGTTSGEEGERSPMSFSENRKIALIMEKNALIVFIRGSNVHCSSNALIENNVLRLPRRKKSKILLCRAFFHVL